MKSSTLIVWLLVAACIAIDLAMIGELQVRRNEWPEAGGQIGLGLSFSQIALVALWAVWGRSNILVRGVSTLLCVWGVSYLASYSSMGSLVSVGKWFGNLLLYCGFSLVAFILARCAGYTISNEVAEKRYATETRLFSHQFTIWGLLSLMTAVGITLAVARFAVFPMLQLVEAVMSFTILAATVCNVLLLALFLSRVRHAIIATIVICPIAAIFLSLTKLAGDEATLELILMMSVQGVATLSAAIVLRTAGYRLVRPAGSRKAMASGSSVASDSVSADQADEP